MSEAAFNGLPGPLPAGERLLWQGTPSWLGLALRAFRVKALSIYFSLMVLWVGAAALTGGVSMGEAARQMLRVAPFAMGVLLLLSGIAWLTARTTTYTITNRRVVIRYGIALPMTLNLPFKMVASAAVRSFADGTADLPLKLTDASRVSYLLLWPHARPWRLVRPQPAMRAVPEGARVARILAEALAAAAGQPVPKVTSAQQPSIGRQPIPTAAAA